MRYSIYILNGMKLCIFYGTHCQCLVMPDFSVEGVSNEKYLTHPLFSSPSTNIL